MMSDLPFFDKIATKTLKKIEHERLLKTKVIPASELANQKQEELERVKAFARAALDEDFVNRTESSASARDPSPIGERVGVITREPFEDLP